MKINILNDYKEMSEYASDVMINCVVKNKNTPTTFILASGDTPTLTYQLFCKKFLEKKLNSKKLYIILLDEWHGLPFGHVSSCYTYILNTIITPLSLPLKNYNYLRSDCKNPLKECQEFEKKISQIKVDLCVLGLGINGHIGFNEPSSEFYLHSHHTELSKDSFKHPMAKGYQNIIKGGVTTGIKSIMYAQKVLLLANGNKKQKVIKKFLSNNIITSNFPVSILHLHKNLECCFVD